MFETSCHRGVNRRGWKVIVSIASDDGEFCVDVFEHPDGGFGYQHFRSAAEDQGAWAPVGAIALAAYESAGAAASAAADSISWLETHPSAQATMASYLKQNQR